MSAERRLKAWLTAIGALGLLLALAPLFAFWQRLPDPIATHFGLSGAPDGKLGRGLFALFPCALVLLLPCSVWRRAPRPPTAEAVATVPLLLGTAAFMSAVAATSSWLTLWHNGDRAVWSDARHLQPGELLLVLGVPLLAGAAVAIAARRRWAALAVAPAPVDVLPLERGERAYWSGGARNRWFWLIGLGIAIEGGVLRLVVGGSPVGLPVLLVHLAVLVLLEQLSTIRVSVDERALTIRYGHLGWVRQRVALERVERATAFELEPWAHGGWGYRGSLKLGGRAAVVVRAGAAVRLDLRDGTRLSITVDDAETAARLINGFLQRRGEPPAGAVLEQLEAHG